MHSTASHSVQFVVPPGQESVVARMLNPPSLAECGWTFVRVAIERTLVHGFYRGTQGELGRVSLAHPAAAPAEWRRTEHFAAALRVRSRHESAAALLRAVIAGVRAAEIDFTWHELEDIVEMPSEPRPEPRDPGRIRPEPANASPTRISACNTRDEEAGRRARAAEEEIDLHLDHTPFVDLQLEFDHAGALAEAMALQDRFVPYQDNPAYGVRGWRGLAIQALDGDAARAATTEADQGIFEDQSRYRLTDVAALCPINLSFLERLLDFGHCRTIAFLLLEPGAQIEVHVDGVGPPVMRSVNVALNMPPGCTMTIDCNPDGSDHPYTRHVPFRDGSVLMLNVAKYHYVVNNSPVPRIHVISRGSMRLPTPHVLALAEAQDGLHGGEAVRAALAEKTRVLSSRSAPGA